MNGKPAKRSSFFLLELIIAILFFSLASAVCVRFFVKSHIISQDTKELNMAVNQVSGCAELFLAEEDYPPHSCTYLSDTWETCGRKAAVYTLQSTVQDDGAYQDGTFAVTRVQDQKVLYSLDVRRYVGDDDTRQDDQMQQDGTIQQDDTMQQDSTIRQDDNKQEVAR